MVAIPPIQSSTVYEINKARLAKHQHWDSVGLGMSELGSECDRQLWYSLRWTSKPETLTGQKLRLFETGNVYESRLIEELKASGFDVHESDIETGKQFKVYSIGGHLRGKLDGICMAVPEAPVAKHVLEIKSHNDKSFSDLLKKKVQASKPSHYAQMQAYMHLTEIQRALYLAVNKNNDELYSERVPYDITFCLKLFARLETIISSPRAPSRISDKPDHYLCMWCRHKDVCHSADFGRRNCRTCLHSTPIVDHESTDATWLCEHHNRTLTVDEQKVGCPSHLYLPAMVPGNQHDAGDDWVSYIMRDGSIWTDKETEAT